MACIFKKYMFIIQKGYAITSSGHFLLEHSCVGHVACLFVHSSCWILGGDGPALPAPAELLCSTGWPGCTGGAAAATHGEPETSGCRGEEVQSTRRQW